MRGDAGRALGRRALRRPRVVLVMALTTGGASFLVMGTHGGKQVLKVWDVATGECVATLRGHKVL